MRENCTYGSMRDILRAEGESRSDALAEVRAFPITRGVPLYSTPSAPYRIGSKNTQVRK